MKEKLMAGLLWAEFVLLFAGMTFDLYTTYQGIEDIFYESGITGHMSYEGNFVGSFSGLALMTLTLFLIFLLFKIKEDIKNKKFSLFTYLYLTAIIVYAAYILYLGIPYIINFFTSR